MCGSELVLVLVILTSTGTIKLKLSAGPDPDQVAEPEPAPPFQQEVQHAPTGSSTIINRKCNTLQQEVQPFQQEVQHAPTGSSTIPTGSATRSNRKFNHSNRKCNTLRQEARPITETLKTSWNRNTQTPTRGKKAGCSQIHARKLWSGGGLQEGGALFVKTKWRTQRWSDPTQPGHQPDAKHEATVERNRKPERPSEPEPKPDPCWEQQAVPPEPT
ncbi:uncharacterized protein LOC111610394 [Xiphophorus maculatus]|uniref:uncharacterized protein LOC111610394 n=1 Tax=Xiphophorus maculatus TaxID=8083 RepID=UPI000C6C9488|nr:uncharacterized protein LOC111610394 [Xiphophorus maculatus]XP_023200219.1 uncharacterized protein LOC111610394 [Xiphophorus maculatus]